MNKRRIIGIGETVFDIVFKDMKPVTAVPGGSTFNSIITLGRLGTKPSILTEIGDDTVGNNIRNFLAENGVDDSLVTVYNGYKTKISLAWLNENNDAHYDFYKHYPEERLKESKLKIEKDDILLISSYFVINPLIREKVAFFIKEARNAGAVIYYDINFRKAHKNELEEVMPFIKENIEMSDIVRCSKEDLDILQTSENWINTDDINNFICTDGGKAVHLKTKNFTAQYIPEKIHPVNTIGAGDNFNAGIVYGIHKGNIMRNEIDNLSKEKWDEIISYAMAFSKEVCMSNYNYIGFKN